MRRFATVTDFLGGEHSALVDERLFLHATDVAVSLLRGRAPQFAPIPMERFYVALLGERSDDCGGFHSRFARGYKYLSHYGLAVIANPAIVDDARLRALDLARCYIHDSIHASTFKTYRWNAAGAPPVYREQYGINFRRASGRPYSDPNLSHEGPRRINLNLLMDGVTVVATARALEPAVASVVGEVQPHGLIADIRADINGMPEASAARLFHDAVTAPTVAFLRHWGGRHLEELVFNAMLSGKLRRLTTYFVEREGELAWCRLFQSAAWREQAADPGSAPVSLSA